MRRGYFAIGLYEPKDLVNIGSVLRLAGNYDASVVMIQGKRYRAVSSDTMKAYRRIPLLEGVDLRASVPFQCVPVAVEISEKSKSLFEFQHPERAFYVFGPEDGSLPEEFLKWRNVISIPTNRCLNLAMSVATILYDRHLKSALNGTWKYPKNREV